MAATAQQLLQIAEDLRDLAHRLTGMLNDATEAASNRTWVGPAAEQYRLLISGQRTALEHVANDLCLVADRVDQAQKLMMASAS